MDPEIRVSGGSVGSMDSSQSTCRILGARDWLAVAEGIEE